MHIVFLVGTTVSLCDIVPFGVYPVFLCYIKLKPFQASAKAKGRLPNAINIYTIHF